MRLRLQYGDAGLPRNHPLYIRTRPWLYQVPVKLREGLYGHVRLTRGGDVVNVWLTKGLGWTRSPNSNPPNYKSIQYMFIRNNGRLFYAPFKGPWEWNRSWEHWLKLSIVKAAYLKYQKDPIK